MARVGIVDGNNVAWRSLLTASDLMYNKAGEETTLLFKFIKSMRSYVSSESLLLTDVIIVWDYGADEEKKALLPTYKEHRKSSKHEDIDLKERYYTQRAILMESVLPVLGVPQLSISGIEADDIIYYLTRKHGKEIEFVVISSDKDLLQCHRYSDIYRLGAGENRGHVLFRKSDPLRKQVGVGPSQFLLYRSLVGDSSDNIPGVSGVGEKTAQAFLKKYPLVQKPKQLIDMAQDGLLELKGTRGLSKIDKDVEKQKELKLSYEMISLARWYVKRADRIEKALKLPLTLKRANKAQDLAEFDRLTRYYSMKTLHKDKLLKTIMAQHVRDRKFWIKIVGRK